MIWCGGRAGEFGVWADKLGISSYTRQIDNYQNRVLDTNISTRNQIDVIFENVAETDRRYAEILRECAENVKEQIARIQVMTEVMESACGIGIYNGIMIFEMEQNSVSQREEMISKGRDILERCLKADENITPAEWDKICGIIEEQQPNMLINLYITDCYSSADSKKVYKAIIDYYKKHKYDRELEYAEGILRRYLITQEIIDAEEQQKIIDMIRAKQPGMLMNLYITDCYSSADSRLVEKAIMDYYKKYGEEPDTPFYNYTKEMVANITTTNSDMDAEIQEFADAYGRNIEIYMELSELTGVPPEVLAVIHYRENTSDYLNGDFQVYLHNGQRLGEVTTREPAGILYYDFNTAAIDAIARKSSFIEKYHLYSKSEDIVAMMCFLEVYNGLGYYNNDYVSPYNYSGTNLYVSGKYVEELNANDEMVSVYHPEIVDEQVGSYLLLKGIMEE